MVLAFNSWALNSTGHHLQLAATNWLWLWTMGQGHFHVYIYEFHMLNFLCLVSIILVVTMWGWRLMMGFCCHMILCVCNSSFSNSIIIEVDWILRANGIGIQLMVLKQWSSSTIDCYKLTLSVGIPTVIADERNSILNMWIKPCHWLLSNPVFQKVIFITIDLYFLI